MNKKRVKISFLNFPYWMLGILVLIIIIYSSSFFSSIQKSNMAWEDSINMPSIIFPIIYLAFASFFAFVSIYYKNMQRIVRWPLAMVSLGCSIVSVLLLLTGSATVGALYSAGLFLTITAFLSCAYSYFILVYWKLIPYATHNKKFLLKIGEAFEWGLYFFGLSIFYLIFYTVLSVQTNTNEISLLDMGTGIFYIMFPFVLFIVILIKMRFISKDKFIKMEKDIVAYRLLVESIVKSSLSLENLEDTIEDVNKKNESLTKKHQNKIEKRQELEKIEASKPALYEEIKSIDSALSLRSLDMVKNDININFNRKSDYETAKWNERYRYEYDAQTQEEKYYRQLSNDASLTKSSEQRHGTSDDATQVAQQMRNAQDQALDLKINEYNALQRRAARRKDDLKRQFREAMRLDNFVRSLEAERQKLEAEKSEINKKIKQKKENEKILNTDYVTSINELQQEENSLKDMMSSQSQQVENLLSEKQNISQNSEQLEISVDQQYQVIMEILNQKK